VSKLPSKSPPVSKVGELTKIKHIHIHKEIQTHKENNDEAGKRHREEKEKHFMGCTRHSKMNLEGSL
jgi:hypothetical protein